MKAAAFDYVRPTTVAEATGLLVANPGAKILAGGQTLGPMLNLRLAQPGLLIDITRIPELTHVEETTDAITLGACITHAAIEDGRVPDPAHGMLARVARGIAHRAVRTRGTIGGSIAHADPAADWVSFLIALGAEVMIAGNAGSRRLAIAAFMIGPLSTELASDEIVTGLRLPKIGNDSQLGWSKISRKSGAFADAIGVAVHEPVKNTLRLVAGATEDRPIVIEDGASLRTTSGGVRLDQDHLREVLIKNGAGLDGYRLNIHVAALERAAAEVLAS